MGGLERGLRWSDGRMEESPEFRLLILEKQQEEVGQVLKDIRDSQKQIAESLAKLTSLEAQHVEQGKALERAFAQIQHHTQQINTIDRALPRDCEDRLRDIEIVMPGLKETRKWVIAGVLGIVSVVGMAILGFAIVKESSHKDEPIQITQDRAR